MLSGKAIFSLIGRENGISPVRNVDLRRFNAVFIMGPPSSDLWPPAMHPFSSSDKRPG
jgi:hypothetical protein